MKKLLFILSLLIIIIFPILFSKEKKIQSSFYHWQNSYNQIKIKEKLYIKILDISYSTKLELSKTIFKTKPSNNSIPTIYITNETLKNTDYKKVNKAILSSLKKLNFSYNEIQIDCDWSLSTKSNYFKLLENLKKQTNKKLSATIRLHQIKYFKKTGIPPVDYGVLMYYNMSDITKLETKNSILDNSIAKKYHYNFDVYNLKLKLALPLYSQAVQFRDKKVLDIFEGVKKEDFDSNFKQIKPNIYKVKTSTYFKKRYIYKGDLFRFEDSKINDIKTAINDFSKLSPNKFDEIIFYRLEYKNKYDIQKLTKETRW